MALTKVGDVVRQLSAADKFLGNVQTLQSFGNIEAQQVMKFQQLLKNAKLNEEQSARAAEAVQCLKNFSAEKKVIMLQVVADGVTFGVPTARCAHPRGPSADTQDYSCLHRYLTEPLWQQLLGEPTVRLHVLCKFAATLGLFLPTEKTVGTFTVILFWNEWKGQKVMPMEKYQTYQTCRLQVRSVLREYNSLATETLRLHQLPPMWSELPATHKTLFAADTFPGNAFSFSFLLPLLPALGPVAGTRKIGDYLIARKHTFKIPFLLQDIKVTSYRPHSKRVRSSP